MKKTWESPDLLDLTISATEKGGCGNGGEDEHSPQEFHCSGATSTGRPNNGRPNNGKPNDGKGDKWHPWF